MQSIREGWYIFTSIGGGVSVIYLLRWYWWRINAWSEISAMISALVCTIVFRIVLGKPYPQVLFYIVPITVAFSLGITFLTRPVDETTLLNFYRRIRPGGVLWKRISNKMPDLADVERPSRMIPAYVLAIVSVYSALLGVGKLLIGPTWQGWLLLVICVLSAYAVWRSVSGILGVKSQNQSG
jgi:SSS family solute:Na+ symporter